MVVKTPHGFQFFKPGIILDILALNISKKGSLNKYRMRMNFVGGNTDWIDWYFGNRPNNLWPEIADPPPKWLTVDWSEWFMPFPADGQALPGREHLVAHPQGSNECILYGSGSWCPTSGWPLELWPGIKWTFSEGHQWVGWPTQPRDFSTNVDTFKVIYAQSNSPAFSTWQFSQLRQTQIYKIPPISCTRPIKMS